MRKYAQRRQRQAPGRLTHAGKGQVQGQDTVGESTQRCCGASP
jgi:hypothetical protein